MALDDVFGVLRQFLADLRHRFLPDDLGCADRIVRTAPDDQPESNHQLQAPVYPLTFFREQRIFNRRALAG